MSGRAVCQLSKEGVVTQAEGKGSVLDDISNIEAFEYVEQMIFSLEQFCVRHNMKTVRMCLLLAGKECERLRRKQISELVDIP